MQVLKIIQNGMNHSEAALLEKELIAKYDTTNPQKGYNVTAGGDGSIGAKHSQATREKLSNIMKERFKDDPKALEVLRSGKSFFDFR